MMYQDVEGRGLEREREMVLHKIHILVINIVDF